MMSNPVKRHRGKLVRVNTVMLPPVPVDFSQASRPTGHGSRGKLIKPRGQVHWVPIDGSRRPKQ